MLADNNIFSKSSAAATMSALVLFFMASAPASGDQFRAPQMVNSYVPRLSSSFISSTANGLPVSTCSSGEMDDFVATVNDVYAKFAGAQRRLDSRLGEAIAEDLWNLYISD